VGRIQSGRAGLENRANIAGCFPRQKLFPSLPPPFFLLSSLCRARARAEVEDSSVRDADVIARLASSLPPPLSSRAFSFPSPLPLFFADSSTGKHEMRPIKSRPSGRLQGGDLFSLFPFPPSPFPLPTFPLFPLSFPFFPRVGQAGKKRLERHTSYRCRAPQPVYISSFLPPLRRPLFLTLFLASGQKVVRRWVNLTGARWAYSNRSASFSLPLVISLFFSLFFSFSPLLSSLGWISEREEMGGRRVK